MELTKKQAIEEHRKMWNWIADAIKNKEDWSVVESCYDWDSLIVKPKYHYLLTYKGQKYTELLSLRGYSNENGRKAYKLALKIANLPEREGV